MPQDNYSGNMLMQAGAEQPMQMAGNGEGLKYLFAPNADAAKLILQQALQQGYRGYMMPLTRSGEHEIRIWKDPQMPSLGPANPYAKG
jgi:hypothetical protein